MRRALARSKEPQAPDAAGIAEGSGPLRPSGSWLALCQEARARVERSRAGLDAMHADDREEATSLHAQIERAIAAADSDLLTAAHRAIDYALLDAVERRNFVHDVGHDLLEDGAESAGSRLAAI